MRDSACNMKKYFKVYSILLKNAFSRDATFRADTFWSWVTHIIWLGMLFILVDTVFRFTTTVAGWSKSDMFLLMNIFILSQQFFLFLFRENVWEIPNIITDGKLDAYMLTPVNTIFLLVSRQISTRALGRLITQTIVLIFIIMHYNYSFSLPHIFAFVLLFIISLAVQLGHSILLNTLGFWFLRIDNINEAYFNIGQIAKYPLSVLPTTIQVIFFTILPIAYQNYTPVGVGLGKLGFDFVLISIGYTILLWWGTLAFWNFSLRRYTSASS